MQLSYGTSFAVLMCYITQTFSFGEHDKQSANASVTIKELERKIYVYIDVDIQQILDEILNGPCGLLKVANGTARLDEASMKCVLSWKELYTPDTHTTMDDSAKAMSMAKEMCSENHEFTLPCCSDPEEIEIIKNRRFGDHDRSWCAETRDRYSKNLFQDINGRCGAITTNQVTSLCLMYKPRFIYSVFSKLFFMFCSAKICLTVSVFRWTGVAIRDQDRATAWRMMETSLSRSIVVRSESSSVSVP